jgi:2'-5' RNA ligase
METGMEAIRAFIAINLPEAVQQQLDALEKQVQDQAGEAGRRIVRWVPASNMHLTLKFLGEVSTTNLQSLDGMLRGEALRYRSFEMAVGQLGAFPNIRRPRVIWAGIQAPDTLIQLQKAIDAGARQLGYPEEERPFSPHLTLGRISQNARPADLAALAEALGKIHPGELGRFTVERIHLFRSELHPTGPVYTPLFTYPLGQ